MYSNLRLSREHAFVLTEPDVKKIWDSLESFFGAVSANVLFTDNIERYAGTLEQLLSFENSKKRSIKQIEFSSTAKNQENRCTVKFEDDYRRPIQVTASGEDEVITRFSDAFEEITDGFKPWYSRICNLDFVYIIGGVAFIGLMLLRIMLPDTANHEPTELSRAVGILSFLFFIMGALFFTVWGLNKVQAYCFAVATFAIGQGIERYRVIEKIRWGVVIAFAVSFTASAVFGLMV